MATQTEQKSTDPYAGLNGDLAMRLHQLVSAVNKQGGNLGIGSGYRTRDEQTQLYNNAVARYGQSNAANWAAVPGTSNHERGLAADLNGDAHSIQLAHQLAPQFGLNFPLNNEAWHVEMTGTRQLHDNQGGPAAIAPDATANTAVGRLGTALSIINSRLNNPDSPVDPTSLTTPTSPAATPQGQVPHGGGTLGASSYDPLFAQAAQKYGLSPELLKAVAKQESGFNPNARSGAGAVGLMQFMPATAQGLGINPLDPAQAIDGAAKLLSNYVKQFGSVQDALAAYNAGPGAVQKYHGIPPYQETQNYVKNIMAMSGGA